MNMFHLPILCIMLFTENVKGKGEEKVPLLEKVERWIRYSLFNYKGVWSNVNPDHKSTSFLPPEITQGVNPYFDDFVGGKCSIKIESTSSDHGTTDKHPLMYNIRNDIFDWYLYSQDEYFVGKLYGLKLNLLAFFGNENERPNWIKTLLKISNLLGWQHFSAFYAVYKIAYITNLEASAFGNGKKEYTNLDKLIPFCTNADIDVAIVEKTLNELGYNRDFREEMEETYEWGQRLADPPLKMVLYRSLIKAIVDPIVPLDQLGGITRATIAPKDYAVYELIHNNNEKKQLECHEGMPRRDYVVYWLLQTYNTLKQTYGENRVKFLKFLQSKSEDNQQLKILYSEYAKYVPLWDQILETVEKDGVHKLDPTINLL